MKIFSNSGICVCQSIPPLWTDRLALDVFERGEEYPYDYFFGPNGKEIRVFEVDGVSNLGIAHILSDLEFERGFMTKAQWNAQNVGN